jgi:hypothetical protein
VGAGKEGSTWGAGADAEGVLATGCGLEVASGSADGLVNMTVSLTEIAMIAMAPRLIQSNSTEDLCEVGLLGLGLATAAGVYLTADGAGAGGIGGVKRAIGGTVGVGFSSFGGGAASSSARCFWAFFNASLIMLIAVVSWLVGQALEVIHSTAHVPIVDFV